MLFSPAWILVVKLHGLYDNDHRRIRHSTLDELPSLVSASVLGTLVLDGLLALSPVGPLSPTSAIALGVGTLLGSFFLRGILRFLWHRLTGLAAGLVIGPAAAVDMVARRVSTHPETRLALVGYLSTGEEAATELPRLGSIADISRVAREHDDRARGRDRAGDERAGGGAADRGVQGGGPGADLPAPALRAARPGDRAQPPGRAAGARLPLQRPARARPWR